MTQPKPENAEVDLRSRNLLGVLEALRGCIFFVKRLRATHVPRGNCTCNGLVCFNLKLCPLSCDTCQESSRLEGKDLCKASLACKLC